MMSFAAFDTILIVIVVLSILVGFYRGFVAECLTLTSWVLASIMTYLYAGFFATFLYPYVHNQTFSLIIMSFVMLLAIIMLSKLLGRLLQMVMTSLGLKALDHIFGVAFGLLRGYLLLLALVTLALILHLDHDQWFLKSQLVPHIRSTAEGLQHWLPQAQSVIQNLSLRG